MGAIRNTVVVVTVILMSISSAQTITPRDTHAGSAVSSVTERLLRIGMTRQDVLTIMGTPDGYRDRVRGTSVTPKEFEVIARIGGPWDEVYRRKTETNEFEIRVFYALDSRESKLHPILRVQSFDFVVDKPAPLSTLLRQIEESVHLCGSGCRVWGMKHPNEMKVFIESPKSDDLLLAPLVATGFSGDASISEGWTPSMTLKLGRKSVGDLGHSDWAIIPIEEVEFGVFNPTFEMKLSSYPYRYTPENVGVWNP